MNNSKFWDDKYYSEEVLSELNFLKSRLSKIEEIKNKIEANLEILEMLKENTDEELLDYQDGEEAGTFLTLYTYNCIDNLSIGNHSVEIIYDENNVAVGQFTIVKYIPEGAVYKVAATGETFGYGGDFPGAPAVGDTFNYNGVEYYFESNEDHTGWCTDDWEDNFLHVINGWPVG